MNASAAAGRGPAETDHKDDTSERLIRAAKKLFARKGFDGATVKELCEEAGVNVSLISYHFGGKEGLYRACLKEFGQSRLEIAKRILSSQTQPSTREEFVARLKLFIEDVMNTHLEEGELTQIIHRECDLEVPVAQDIFQSTFMEAFKLLIEFIRNGQKAGVLDSSLNPQVLGGMLFGSVMHYSRADRINKKFFGQTLRDERYRSEVIDHIVRVILTGAEAPK